MRPRGRWRTKGLSRSVALVTSVAIEPSGCHEAPSSLLMMVLSVVKPLLKVV